MELSTIQRPVHAADLPPEQLAKNSTLSEQQKIAEASRQFEAILLRQILSQTQKPVIASKFSDNSVSGSIYRDMVTNQLADSMSKSGGIGLAQTFERQLTHQGPASAAAGAKGPHPPHAAVSSTETTTLSKTRRAPLMHGAYYLMKHE